jgi:hypothetical protein
MQSENRIVLKSWMNWGRRWVRFKDKLSLLEQGMPNDAVSARLRLAFAQAMNNVSRVIDGEASYSNGHANPYDTLGVSENEDEFWTWIKK